MKDKLYEFYAYRYFIIETEQGSILHQLNDKRELFLNIFDDLRKSKKQEITERGKKYLLYHSMDISNTVILTKFAKCKSSTHYEPRPDDIVKTKEEDYPFIFVIIDLEGQSLLIQKNTVLFFSPNATRRILEKYLTNIMAKNHFTVKISEVTYYEKFWDTIENAEKIYSLKLNLKSPNLFEGQLAADELLRKQRDLYNNTELNIEYKNEDGKLKILRDNLSQFIRYISEGGGHYILAFVKNGITKHLKSAINIKRFHLRDPSEEAFTGLLNAIKELKEIEKDTK